MAVLGIGGLDHNGSVALAEGGRVIAFLEAERPTRVKNVGLKDPSQVDAVLARLPVLPIRRIGVADRAWWALRRPDLEPYLRARFDAPIDVWPHHDCHALAALTASPWDSALSVTIDGKGDDLSATATMVSRTDGVVRRLIDVPSRDSIGRLWWAVSEYCGFPGHHSAGKTMALAAYGRDIGVFDDVIHVDASGRFEVGAGHALDGTFRNVSRIVAWLAERLGAGPGEDPVRCRDAAASLQAATERVVVGLVGAAVAASGSRRVVLSGGVALNGLANQRLLSEGVVESLFVVPCCDDRGLSLGAAALSAAADGQPLRARAPHLSPFLGPSPEASGSLAGWRSTGATIDDVAMAIAEGCVVAWFSGRDEAGPRALGHRSLLVSPIDTNTRHVVNQRKGREHFRPFGCTILAESATEWFELDGPSPFMLQIARARALASAGIPAVLHVDGTSRIQTVSADDESTLWPLLSALVSLGHPPALLNTSLNVAGEPLAHTAAEAAVTAMRLGADRLVVEGVVYVRS